MEKLIQSYRRFTANLKPENRIGRVYGLQVNPAKPLQARVIVDRGERDVEYYGIWREFKESDISTQKVVEQGLREGDFVTIGWLGIINRLGSYEELAELRLDMEQLSARFFDLKSITEVGGSNKAE